MIWRAFRSALQTIHLWASFVLCLPFIVIGLTGSILVLYAEWPDLGVPRATAKGTMQPLQRIIDAARAEGPGQPVGAIILPTRDGQAAAVQFARPPNARVAGGGIYARTVFVDPVSLKVLAATPRPPATLLNRRIHQLHEIFMMPAYSGTRIVGILGIAMTLFGLTGIMLWWPSRGAWRRAFTFRPGLKGHRLHRELHSVFGIWFLAAFMVMSVTGVSLEFPLTTREVLGSFLPMRGETSAFDPGIAGGTIDVDQAASRALGAVRDARLISIGLPFNPEGAYFVTLAPSFYDNEAPQIFVLVARDGSLVDVADPRDDGAGRQLMTWMRTLHYGNGIGTIWKILVFLSGLLPLFFTVTGLSMWCLRRTRRKANRGNGPVQAAIPAE